MSDSLLTSDHVFGLSGRLVVLYYFKVEHYSITCSKFGAAPLWKYSALNNITAK